MKIENLVTEEDYQKEKERLLREEHQTKNQIASDNLGGWAKTMEEILAFASNVTKIFHKEDTEAKRMVLRILGSNLILKDRIVRIDAKNAVIYLKKIEKSMNEKKQRLEPKNMPTDRTKRALLEMQSDMERVGGVEPPSSAWKAEVIPVYDTRLCLYFILFLFSYPLHKLYYSIIHNHMSFLHWLSKFHSR